MLLLVTQLLYGIWVGHLPQLDEKISSMLKFPYCLLVCISFMIGPLRISYLWKAIYQPFEPHVWLTVVLFMVVVIVNRAGGKINGDLSNAQKLGGILCFHFSWPRSPKVMLVVWLLTAIIFNTLYVSKIQYFRFIRANQEHFNSLLNLMDFPGDLTTLKEISLLTLNPLVIQYSSKCLQKWAMKVIPHSLKTLLESRGQVWQTILPTGT